MVGLKKLETTKNGNYILRDPIEEEEKQYTTTNTTGQHQNSTTASTKRTTKHLVMLSEKATGFGGRKSNLFELPNIRQNDRNRPK